mmetsp:Transcript_10496/g.24327  ORF Transcript_10496/g.24327 Transcript_10496/m.24327 type:complete len:117 (-) Transcript_10496:161-511(-)
MSVRYMFLPSLGRCLNKKGAQQSPKVDMTRQVRKITRVTTQQREARRKIGRQMQTNATRRHNNETAGTCDAVCEQHQLIVLQRWMRSLQNIAPRNKEISRTSGLRHDSSGTTGKAR